MKKRIVVISIVLIAATLVFGIFLAIKPNRENNKKSIAVATASVGNLSITNKDTYSKTISDAVFTTTEDSLYKKIKSTGTTKIAGIVRTDSVKTNNRVEDVKTVRFIVDIPDLKQTYVVSYGTDDSTGEKSIYILCPDKTERIYPEFSCESDIL